MWQIFLTQSTEAAKLALFMLGNILSRLIGLLIIVVIGWLVAKAIKALIVKVLQTLKLDSVAESTGVNSFLAKGGIKQALSEVVGGLIYWLCLLVVAAVAVDFMGLQVIGELLNKIILYVPNIIISIFILLAGVFMAKLLSAMIQTAAANAGLVRARLLARIAEVIVMVAAIAIALEQLNIAAELVSLVVKSIIISIAAASAIAFGLGCKDMAAKTLTSWLDKIQEKR
ncbi:MAG: hypothetical protein PHY46_01775 [Candidatus Omnitrophica bacterium]|nr:hypothetical protein [Candidatus Omnitrophota bacterium]MDD5356246.1 hypothetical protein [Candidatus Omnitrophota bacterium]